MYEHLIVKEQGRLVEVHLNRPQVRHALSRALMREITAVARALSDRTDNDVVIHTITSFSR
jgi:enoyl-CoA hydratase/carnithine racemase